MTIIKRAVALVLTLLLVLSFSACNKEDEDAVLTTKRKVTTTKSGGEEIDIWSYLGDESLEGTLSEETGTIPFSSGIGSYSTKTYEDVPVSFGGTTVFSSATTAKSGYPTFKWNPVSGAIKYNIYRSTSKNGTYSYLDTTTATSYTDKTAVSGTKYYYQVKAVKKVSESKTTTKATGGTTKPTTKPTTANTGFNPPARDASKAPASAPQNFTKVADIVALYNLAANNVISKATAVARTNRVIQELVYDTGSAAAGLSTGILKNWLGITNGPSINSTVRVFTGDQAKEEFPSDTYADTASKLTTSMVRSASCVYQDGYYNVTIILKDDPEFTSEYSQTCLNVLHPSTIYSGATAQAKVIQLETEDKPYAPMLQAQIWYDGYQLDYVIDQVPTILAIRADEGDITLDTSLAILMIERWAVQY